MAFNDLTYDALGAAIGAASRNQQVISNNLANVNTPGYKRMQVNFQDLLRNTIERAEGGSGRDALREFTPLVETDGATSMRADGNNVDVDAEMAKLSENQIRYNTLIEIMSKRNQMLRFVATDGRG